MVLPRDEGRFYPTLGTGSGRPLPAGGRPKIGLS